MLASDSDPRGKGKKKKKKKEEEEEQKVNSRVAAPGLSSSNRLDGYDTNEPFDLTLGADIS